VKIQFAPSESLRTNTILGFPSIVRMKLAMLLHKGYIHPEIFNLQFPITMQIPTRAAAPPNVTEEVTTTTLLTQTDHTPTLSAFNKSPWQWHHLADHWKRLNISPLSTTRLGISCPHHMPITSQPYQIHHRPPDTSEITRTQATPFIKEEAEFAKDSLFGEDNRQAALAAYNKSMEEITNHLATQPTKQLPAWIHRDFRQRVTYKAPTAPATKVNFENEPTSLPIQSPLLTFKVSLDF
jgi:hypothetical protein